MNLVEKRVDALMKKAAYKTLLKKSKEKKGEKPDMNNPVELYKYYQDNGIEPEEIIENEDGTKTYIYESGLAVLVNIKLSGIPTPDDVHRKLHLVKEKK